MTFPYQEFAREKMPALLADLKDLIAIDSVRNMDLATPEFPVGPGPVKALEKFLALGADRLGTSRAVKILNGEQAKGY